MQVLAMKGKQPSFPLTNFIFPVQMAKQWFAYMHTGHLVHQTVVLPIPVGSKLITIGHKEYRTRENLKNHFKKHKSGQQLQDVVRGCKVI
jgi:hypothetical protein